MTDASRRAFLAATGTTAAAAVALGASPASYASSTASSTAPSSDGQDQADLVAYVHSGTSGLVTLLVGEREVVVRDRALARSLLRAARS